MILDLELQLTCNGPLTILDAGIHELLNLAAIEADDVIVVIAFVQLEDGGRALEMMTADEAGRLELRENSVDGRESNVLVQFEQALVDVLGTHVARRGRSQDLEDLQARQRDFEACLAQLVSLNRIRIHSGPPPLCRPSAQAAAFQYDARPLSRTSAELGHLWGVGVDPTRFMRTLRDKKMTLSRAPRLLRGCFGALLLSLFGLLASGCVHRIPIQQGNFLEAKDVDRVTTGMTRVQVRALLGTPMIADPFHQARWDYYYYFVSKRVTTPIRQHFIVHFDEEDKVVRIERTGETTNTDSVPSPDDDPGQTASIR